MAATGSLDLLARALGQTEAIIARVRPPRSVALPQRVRDSAAAISCWLLAAPLRVTTTPPLRNHR